MQFYLALQNLKPIYFFKKLGETNYILISSYFKSFTPPDNDIYEIKYISDDSFQGQYMFYKSEYITEINFISIKDMPNYNQSMFQRCKNLKKLNLGLNFNTEGVRDMRYTFLECSRLTSLVLGEYFNTENVGQMSSMFAECSNLKYLNLSPKFNTKYVKEMDSMFKDCKELTSLNLGEHFITTEVYTMETSL